MSSCEILRVRIVGEKPSFADGSAGVVVCKVRTTVTVLWRHKRLVTSSNKTTDYLKKIVNA